MISLAYPVPDFKTQIKNGRTFVFDSLRKCWLLLTPEEWVRQLFVQYLLQVKGYPATLVALEKEIWFNGLKKRFDILVYDGQHQPWMLVECKAESVVLGPAVLEQVLRYNLSVPVPYMVITNGKNCFAWRKEAHALIELEELPHFATTQKGNGSIT